MDQISNGSKIKSSTNLRVLLLHSYNLQLNACFDASRIVARFSLQLIEKGLLSFVLKQFTLKTKIWID